jgi:hypothetical protein
MKIPQVNLVPKFLKKKIEDDDGGGYSYVPPPAMEDKLGEQSSASTAPTEEESVPEDTQESARASQSTRNLTCSRAMSRDDMLKSRRRQGNRSRSRDTGRRSSSTTRRRSRSRSRGKPDRRSAGKEDELNESLRSLFLEDSNHEEDQDSTAKDLEVSIHSMKSDGTLDLDGEEKKIIEIITDGSGSFSSFGRASLSSLHNSDMSLNSRTRPMRSSQRSISPGRSSRRGVRDLSRDSRGSKGKEHRSRRMPRGGSARSLGNPSQISVISTGSSKNAEFVLDDSGSVASLGNRSRRMPRGGSKEQLRLSCCHSTGDLNGPSQASVSHIGGTKNADFATIFSSAESLSVASLGNRSRRMPRGGSKEQLWLSSCHSTGDLDGPSQASVSHIDGTKNADFATIFSSAESLSAAIKINRSRRMPRGGSKEQLLGSTHHSAGTLLQHSHSKNEIGNASTNNAEFASVLGVSSSAQVRGSRFRGSRIAAKNHRSPGSTLLRDSISIGGHNNDFETTLNDSAVFHNSDLPSRQFTQKKTSSSKQLSSNLMASLKNDLVIKKNTT